MTPAAHAHRLRKQRERRAKKKAMGHCKDCPATTIYSSERCKSCYEKFKKVCKPSRDRWAARKKASGLCYICGRRKPAPDYKSCAKCRAHLSERDKVTRALTSTEPLRGEEHQAAKYSDAVIENIRTSTDSGAECARRHGCPRAYVYHVRSNRRRASEDYVPYDRRKKRAS